MNELIAPIIVTAIGSIIGSSAFIYMLQRYAPSRVDDATAKSIEQQIDERAQKMILDLVEHYKAIVSEQNLREDQHLKIIDEYKQRIELLEDENKSLQDALEQNSLMIDELKRRLFSAEQDTASYPYMAVLANVFKYAEAEQWEKIIPEIRKASNVNHLLREKIYAVIKEK